MIIFTTFEENIISMRLKYFKVSKLHGYLNKEIKFFDGVNLIVGINGSGKTSVLNMINWMLTPDLGHLCITHFKEAKLEFEYNKKQYVIKCWQDKDFLRYSITLNETEYHPLEVKLIADNSSIRFGASRENLLQHYIGLRPESKEVETWNLISKLPSPKIVGLDRFAENFNRSLPYEIFRDEEGKRKDKFSSPIEGAKHMIRQYYIRTSYAISELSTKLKTRLFLLTLQPIQSHTGKNPNSINIDTNIILDVENRINKIIEAPEKFKFSAEETNSIKRYFTFLKDMAHQQVQDEDNDGKLLYLVNAIQFARASEFLDEFEKFEKDSNRTLSKVNQFLVAVNSFIKDSAKEIYFDEKTSELLYRITNDNGKTIKEGLDVGYLSSGEQQLLILFSYIAFNKGNSSLIIIDEPELSLHIKWQEVFMKNLDLVRDSSTQIILATHSPILVNKKRSNVILLNSK